MSPSTSAETSRERSRPANVSTATGSARLSLSSEPRGPRAHIPWLAGATSFEVMSTVIRNPLVPLNSKALGPTR